jgi:prevent-host-death family protein
VKPKANLGRYVRVCRDEPVIVTVNGKPAFQIAPLTEPDDLVDNLVKHNPKFQATLEKRLNEKTVSARNARRRL